MNYAARAHAAAPDDFSIRHQYTECLLSQSRFGQAAGLLQRSAPHSPLQIQIGLRAPALRGLGDPDYCRLYDYNRFTAQILIDLPRGALRGWSVSTRCSARSSRPCTRQWRSRSTRLCSGERSPSGDYGRVRNLSSRPSKMQCFPPRNGSSKRCQMIQVMNSCRKNLRRLPAPAHGPSCSRPGAASRPDSSGRLDQRLSFCRGARGGAPAQSPRSSTTW